MNQAERELFFRGEEECNNPLRKQYVFPSNGNHKRSPIGKGWYYLAESDDNYNLFKDHIVGETPAGYYIQIYMDGELVSDNLIFIERDKYNEVYPVQPLFPISMSDTSALVILKEYFEDKERSTTREIVSN